MCLSCAELADNPSGNAAASGSRTKSQAVQKGRHFKSVLFIKDIFKLYLLTNVCLFVQTIINHLAPWMDRNKGNEKKKKKEEAYIYYTEISPSNYAMLHPTHILSYFPESTESLCC